MKTTTTPKPEPTLHDRLMRTLYEVIYSVRALDDPGALANAITQTKQVLSMLQGVSHTEKATHSASTGGTKA